ncbi:hypothetical protein BST61_g9958 [Cercospora zeina]
MLSDPLIVNLSTIGHSIRLSLAFRGTSKRRFQTAAPRTAQPHEPTRCLGATRVDWSVSLGYIRQHAIVIYRCQ